MTRPTHPAAQAQQKRIDKMELQLAFLARLAGVSPQFEEISKQADALNPAQPIPDPASEGPSETTEQARTPEASDDPQNPGETGGSVQHLPAEATDTPLTPGATLPTSPFGDLEEVTAPVAGTETHVPNEQTRIETDVRVGDPMNMQKAFPWTIGGKEANRTLASLHLARLRLAVGVAEGDDITVSAAIEGDEGISNEAIAHEINILTGVSKAAAKRPARNAGLVPRAASVGRTVPSLASEGISSTAGLGNAEDASDLFD